MIDTITPHPPSTHILWHCICTLYLLSLSPSLITHTHTHTHTQKVALSESIIHVYDHEALSYNNPTSRPSTFNYVPSKTHLYYQTQHIYRSFSNIVHIRSPFIFAYRWVRQSKIMQALLLSVDSNMTTCTSHLQPEESNYLLLGMNNKSTGYQPVGRHPPPHTDTDTHTQINT